MIAMKKNNNNSDNNADDLVKKIAELTYTKL